MSAHASSTLPEQEKLRPAGRTPAASGARAALSSRVAPPLSGEAGEVGVRAGRGAHGGPGWGQGSPRSLALKGNGQGQPQVVASRKEEAKALRTPSERLKERGKWKWAKRAMEIAKRKSWREKGGRAAHSRAASAGRSLLRDSGSDECPRAAPGAPSSCPGEEKRREGEKQEREERREIPAPTRLAGIVSGGREKEGGVKWKEGREKRKVGRERERERERGRGRERKCYWYSSEGGRGARAV
ncbi:hypothetical protein P7K49_008101 [Saguinus oedipus]|uniref:Uncharacterized protein n=1 Tax=Saguinus oedipus TaxID=9490 RepID=A0ABQ9VXH7_SAGOE|nr:hypothetical protein P7K49_008101 [Saguinus oedipus]